MLEEQIDDGFVPHLGRRLDRRLVPRRPGVHHGWVLHDQLSDPREVAVSIADALFYYGLRHRLRNRLHNHYLN